MFRRRGATCIRSWKGRRGGGATGNHRTARTPSRCRGCFFVAGTTFSSLPVRRPTRPCRRPAKAAAVNVVFYGAARQSAAPLHRARHAEAAPPARMSPSSEGSWASLAFAPDREALLRKGGPGVRDAGTQSLAARPAALPQGRVSEVEARVEPTGDPRPRISVVPTCLRLTGCASLNNLVGELRSRSAGSATSRNGSERRITCFPGSPPRKHRRAGSSVGRATD